MVSDAVAKQGITRGDIRSLVARFYDKARRHPRLGTIFHTHVGEDEDAWTAHLAKIEDFWANVMLKDRAYDGNPMQDHMAIGQLRATDFDIWLGLFHETAAEVLPQEKAKAFIIMSDRIGRSLAMGIERVRANGVPRLTA